MVEEIMSPSASPAGTFALQQLVVELSCAGSDIDLPVGRDSFRAAHNHVEDRGRLRRAPRRSRDELGDDEFVHIWVSLRYSA